MHSLRITCAFEIPVWTSSKHVNDNEQLANMPYTVYIGYSDNGYSDIIIP